jgi:uncharacterized protein YcgL (UPF0745 family)
MRQATHMTSVLLFHIVYKLAKQLDKITEVYRVYKRDKKGLYVSERDSATGTVPA